MQLAGINESMGKSSVFSPDLESDATAKFRQESFENHMTEQANAGAIQASIAP
ncbi:MAG TPA: hypothetical protein VJL56_05625 [Candidatus Bathyarchaeia archaeon]|nr:hypothetical protein [Candidatus Bathyarchaeia archaeon]